MLRSAIHNTILLITKKAVVDVAFGDLNNLWRTSFLRKYLNETFLNNCFSEEEKQLICENDLSNGADGKTTDKVYVLSQNEVHRYFPLEKSRNAGAPWQLREGKYIVYLGEIQESWQKRCLH